MKVLTRKDEPASSSSSVAISDFVGSRFRRKLTAARTRSLRPSLPDSARDERFPHGSRTACQRDPGAVLPYHQKLTCVGERGEKSRAWQQSPYGPSVRNLPRATTSTIVLSSRVHAATGRRS